NFRTGREPGIIDWYTGLVGLFTLAALAGHGALFLTWRTAGPIRERSLSIARKAWKAVIVLWAAVTAATAWVQPEAFASFVARPWALSFIALSAVGIFGVFWFAGRGRDLAAFLFSCAFLLGLVATALAGNYPFWLRSTIDPSYSLTSSSAASGRYGMGVALV